MKPEPGPNRAEPQFDLATSDARMGDSGTDLVPRMLKVTAAMGLSGGLVVALSAVRAKLVALELGPEGLGSLTLLLAFLGLATAVGGFGVGSAGIREVAAADSDPDKSERDALRRALYATASVLAVITAVVIAAAARPIAGALFGDYGLTDETRLCALAAFFAILASAPVGDLSGLRRIRSLAIVQALAAVLATAATLVCFLTNTSLLAAVVIAPSATLTICALAYARSLPERGGKLSAREHFRSARRLMGVGTAFALNVGLAAASALILRVLIESQLGRADTGEFQAAYLLATYFVTFVVAAYGADYLPLLSGMRADAQRLNHTTNTQLMVAVLITVPAITFLIAVAPLAVPLLYSHSFEQAPAVLRLMLVGEIARLAGWTISYILIARSAPLFIAMEVIYNGLVIGATAVLAPELGLKGTGVAYLVAQVLGLAAALLLARVTSGFRLSAVNMAYLAASTVAVGVSYAGAVIGGWAMAATLATTVGATYLAARQLSALARSGTSHSLRWTRS